MNFVKVLIQIVKFLLFLVVLLSKQDINAQQWTLKNCVNQAIKNHPDIKSAQLDLRVSLSRVDQAKSNFYPELGASVFQSGNFGRSIDRFTNAYIDQYYNTTYAGFGVSTPIFTSFRNCHLLASSKSDVTSRENGVEKAKNILTLSVIVSYLNALSQVENIRNARIQLKNDSIQTERFTIRKAAGLTTKTEEIQLPNQIKSDELAVLDAELDQESALITLSQQMNVKVSNLITLSPVEPDIFFSFSDQSRINESLPQIRELKLRIQSQNENIKATKALSYPVIGLSADYSTFYASSNPERTFTQQLNDTRNGSISLGLTIPILRGLKNRPVIQELKVQQMITQNNLDKILLDIQQEIEMALSRFRILKKRYENARNLLELATENMTLVTEQLSAGNITMVDFLLAQSIMERASGALTITKYQLILQEKILKFYSEGKYVLD
ncbi:MAG: TolC family protein [Saprospiraceae bacterium]|nr:TolC family protein [Saprospiraceae bacterium]